MNARRTTTDFLALGGRWVLGAFFIWMGLNKALHPVEFLKLVRQYELLHSPLLLNLIAAGLPWFEIFCGLLLLSGVAVRGSALLVFGMLVPFTLAIAHRAWLIHGASGLAFCAIKFDCGCGSGEVFVCRKLAENALWITLSAWLAWRPRHLLTPCCRGTCTGACGRTPSESSATAGRGQ